MDMTLTIAFKKALGRWDKKLRGSSLRNETPPFSFPSQTFFLALTLYQSGVSFLCQPLPGPEAWAGMSGPRALPGHVQGSSSRPSPVLPSLEFLSPATCGSRFLAPHFLNKILLLLGDRSTSESRSGPSFGFGPIILWKRSFFLSCSLLPSSAKYE